MQLSSTGDGKRLLQTVPFGETIANVTTDAANIADRVVHGDGAKAEKAKKRKPNYNQRILHRLLT